MKLSEKVSFHVDGHLEITDSNGLIVFSKKNLIVNTAKSIMASSLVGHTSSDYIAYAAFGVGDGAGSATPPTITDRALQNQTYQIDVSFEDQPTPYFEDQVESDGSTTTASTVVFSGIVPSDAAFVATEAGLFSVKEFMFSRITIPALTKSLSTSWLVRWTLSMRIA